METYGIVDYRELPPDRVALFSVGLRENSRIKMKYSGWNFDLKTQLLATIADGINTLIWAKTKDAKRGMNRPKSIYDQLMAKEEKKKIQSFKTPEEFFEKWNSL